MNHEQHFVVLKDGDDPPNGYPRFFSSITTLEYNNNIFLLSLKYLLKIELS